MAPTRSAMFWVKSREIVEGGEAGKELEGLRRREGKGGARRRRRDKGCGRSGANELTGRGSRRSASTREPSGPSNRSRPGRKSSAPYVGRLGRGRGNGAWLRLGAERRGSPGGPPGSLGRWGLRKRARGRLSREAAARVRVARAAASSLAGRSERPLRALLAGYRARAWAKGRSHARQYMALRGRSAGRAGAGLIGRPAAVDPPSYANTSVSAVNNSYGRRVAEERRLTRWQLNSDSQRFASRRETLLAINTSPRAKKRALTQAGCVVCARHVVFIPTYEVGVICRVLQMRKLVQVK
ncbi:uncharacterized protein [Callorhinus ursinus]|uniref:uncharacterized protein n=1 Tax=Callorhinus ursinus TaxID=34884 RepID=UPI003CD03D6D